MSTSPIVFMDTETTGLSLEDDIWEFAGIRREPDGAQTELHLFIEHSAAKCMALPESFRADHENRFPSSHTAKWHPSVVRKSDAAAQIDEFLQGRPHIVGAVPNFDTERIAQLCTDWFEDWRAPWHYHLVDVENLIVGFLAGREMPIHPPWNSDELSAALGISVPADERHTAMGDARWAMRIYDAVMSGQIQ